MSTCWALSLSNDITDAAAVVTTVLAVEVDDGVYFIRDLFLDTTDVDVSRAASSGRAMGRTSPGHRRRVVEQRGNRTRGHFRRRVFSRGRRCREEGIRMPLRWRRQVGRVPGRAL